MDFLFVSHYLFIAESYLCFSKVNTKVFISYDTLDLVIKIAEAKKIASTWKDAIFYETNGLGHSMHDNQLYHKVSDFLFENES